MVVINNNPESQELDMNRFAEMIKGVKSGTDIISDKMVSLENKLIVEGKSSMIIELK